MATTAAWGLAVLNFRTTTRQVQGACTAHSANVHKTTPPSYLSSMALAGMLPESMKLSRAQALGNRLISNNSTRVEAACPAAR